MNDPKSPAQNYNSDWMQPNTLLARLQGLGLEREAYRSSWIDSAAYDVERKILYVWFHVVKKGSPAGVKAFAYPNVDTFSAGGLDSGATTSKGLWAYHAIKSGQLKNYVELPGAGGGIGTWVPNTQYVNGAGAPKTK